MPAGSQRSSPNRRSFVLAAFARVAALTVMFGSFLARPSTAQVKPQAPGFHRLLVGDFVVTALNDGVVSYRTAMLLPTLSPERISKSLFDMGLTDPFGMSYNAFLIDTGDKIVLIDTGSGGKLASSPLFAGTGRVLANLTAAGYRPEQVDEIYISHLGPDHIGGLTQAGKRAFPNAIVRVAASEIASFLTPSKVGIKADDPRLPFWRELFQPYADAGKLQPFEVDGPLAPGIDALITAGHTPGHTSYLVESKSQRLLVLGDLILVAAIQFAEPSLPSAFDVDREAGVTQRQRILELAASRDYLIAGAHLSFPGLGRVRPSSPGYRWLPIDFAIPEPIRAGPK